jgi:spectinomycin phosphotransferase
LKEQGWSRSFPLPTNTQQPWSKIDPFTLILYPFIEGKSGWKVGLSDSQWVAFGAVLKRLHSLRLSPDLLNRIAKETFVPHPKWTTTVKQLHAAVHSQVHDQPYEKS